LPADWAGPPRDLRLTSGELHVWRAGLDLSAERRAALAATLSPEEISRAQRFRYPELSERFVAGRGIVRDILARYLGRSAESLEFQTGERGKPALVGDDAGLRFNASNSGAVTLVAVAREAEVGVDVEVLRPVPEALAIAGRMLSPRECERLRSVPSDQLEMAFLHCWTRKEAYIKAIGAGLWTGLDTFDVAFAPDETPALLSVDGSEEAAERWTLRSIAPGPPYVAAVVVEGRAGEIRTFQWIP
jgi:4'-phosphopantetheinyl transferase